MSPRRKPSTAALPGRSLVCPVQLESCTCMLHRHRPALPFRTRGPRDGLPLRTGFRASGPRKQGFQAEAASAEPQKQEQCRDER